MPASHVSDLDLVLFRSPDCEDWAEPTAPALANDHAGLLAHVEAALERRQRDYPGLVAKGDVAEPVAKADLSGWRFLQREWRWIALGEGAPPHPLTLRRRLAAVELALERIETELARVGAGWRAELIRQQNLNTALHWHLTTLKFGEPAVHFWTDCNRELRARAAGGTTARPEICATCERRAADPATFACTRPDCGLKHKDAA